MNLFDRIIYFFSSKEEQNKDYPVVKAVYPTLTVEESVKVDEEIKHFNEFLQIEYKRGKAKVERDNKKFNSNCPHCKSKNVNDRIKENKIELKTRSSSRSAGYFSSASSEANFKSSSHPVNKCNDCQHEWLKKNDKFDSNYTFYIHQISRACSFIERNGNVIPENSYFAEIIKKLIPHISVESFFKFRDTFDRWYIEDFDRDYVSHERLKILGFKTLKENNR